MISRVLFPVRLGWTRTESTIDWKRWSDPLIASDHRLLPCEWHQSGKYASQTAQWSSQWMWGEVSSPKSQTFVRIDWEWTLKLCNWMCGPIWKHKWCKIDDKIGVHFYTAFSPCSYVSPTSLPLLLDFISLIQVFSYSDWNLEYFNTTKD